MLVLCGLAGCSESTWFTGTIGTGPSDEALTAEVPDRSPFQLGTAAYRRSDFGQAERYFRAAIEHNSRDVKAWIGLAASYDQLRRFDLADRAYQEAIKLAGETVQIINNQGYSYLLRGDLKAAREKFEKAIKLRPGDPTIANNVKLLNGKRVDLPG